jgi:hypothetical protein
MPNSDGLEYLRVCVLRAVQAVDAAGTVRFQQTKPAMLWDLKPCDIGNSLSGLQCQLRYWDSMTEDARVKATFERPLAGELGLAGGPQVHAGSCWRYSRRRSALLIPVG